MPVELTDEEKAKLDAYLAEQGYDENAKETLKRRDQLLRESQAKVKKFEEDEAKRRADEQARADEAKRKADEDAEKQRKLDDEKKSLEQRLEDFEKRFAEKLENGNKEAEKQRKDLISQIERRDQRILLQAVKTAAKERGIIDADLVEMLDLKKVKVDDGEPDLDEIKALIDQHATAKPHLYKEPETDEQRAARERDDQGRFTRPTPKPKPGDIDWDKLSPEEFARKEAELVRSRQ